MDFYMKLPRNKKEFAFFMGVILILSVHIIAPLITYIEIGFHLSVWQDVGKVIPFLWLGVIGVVLITYIPAEKMTKAIVAKEDSFHSRIVIDILCTGLLMSILLTAIGTGSITLEPIQMFFYKCLGTL